MQIFSLGSLVFIIKTVAKSSAKNENVIWQHFSNKCFLQKYKIVKKMIKGGDTDTVGLTV